MTDTAEKSAERPTRKERVGVVVSDVRDKTITVTVERRTTHGLYGKTLSRTKKLTVHDETNDANVGDTVRVIETRPISKTKRWRLAEVVERAK